MLSGLATLLLWANVIVSTLAYCAAPEPNTKICYNYNYTDPYPKIVELGNLQHVAQYLRAYGQTQPRHFWTMKASDGADNCAEWEVFRYQTVMVLAKLVGQVDASVTYEDIADTIDGGAEVSLKHWEASIFGCGMPGGQMGVVTNAADPYYKTPAFKSSALVNTGILIKVVGIPKGSP